MTNVNVLEGVRCPKCGSEGPFRIAALTTAMVDDNGIVDTEETFWEDDAQTSCKDCGFTSEFVKFKAAAQVPTLTLGELRHRTAHLPDATPITAATPDGEWWYNLGLDQSSLDQLEREDGPPSLILDTRDDFDTRQW